MRKELRRADWQAELDGLSAGQAWDKLKEKVHHLISRHVPERRRRNHNKPPWLSREILRQIRKKKRKWRLAKQGQNVEEYKEEERKLRNMIRNAKRNFERKIARGCGSEQANKRRFFSYIKQKTKTRTGIGPLKDGMGRIVQDHAGMANLLNNFFSSVFTQEDTTNVPEPEGQGSRAKLEWIKITEKAVKEKIKRLRTDAAAGPDGIGPSLLQKLVHEISAPLARIMQRSLDDGDVPADWKTANVTPIFKKGAKSDPGNYRPVSLTAVSCKIMESVLKDEMVKHLEKNKLIRQSQHGFMKNRACVTNLLTFLEKATAEVDSGEAVDVVYLDFAKAFDKVPHARLKKKMAAHGIGGRLLNWIVAWLSNRSQRVVLNGAVSDWAAVLSGVPQGSVLGPLLFLIFINDLDTAVSQEDGLLKFADDTRVARVIRGEADRLGLQQALDRLMDWSNRWGMQFNVKKCKVMHLGRNNTESEYRMGGKALEKTVEERDLGIQVSNKLKPAAQCAHAARTAQAVLGQISRAFQYRDRSIFVQLYKQYVRPHLEFSVQAWSPWSAADKELLEKVQRRAVRMVSGLKSRDYEDRLRELNLTTLEERRHRADMLQMYKIVHAGDSLDKATWFRPHTEAARTRLRADPLNVRPNHGRLEIRRNFFSVRAGDCWNAVPAHIKRARTAVNFKNAYAKFRNEMITNLV
jgi:hypothetical protein